MGDLTLSILLLLLTISPFLCFNKNPTAETFFNLDDQFSPDQFDLQEDNNDLKATRDFEDGDFYMKEIYRPDDAKEFSKEIYLKGKEGQKDFGESKEEARKRKLREQYQIDQAVLDVDMDFRKPLEKVGRENHTKKPSSNRADYYETLKSKSVKGKQPARKSPEEFGLRHSEDGTFPELIESSNKLYDPKESDLNSTRLRVKLGGFFDPSFMSVVKPKSENESYENRTKENHLHNFTRNKNGRLIPKEELPDYLKEINFKYIYLSDGNKIRTRISSKLKKKLQQFLQTYTKCRISYKWKDLGPRFWPRYLKAGYCAAGGRASCSIPPGMTCRPGRSDYKTLLRFHCARGRGEEGEGNCHWRNVKYPVTTSCTCACG